MPLPFDKITLVYWILVLFVTIPIDILSCSVGQSILSFTDVFIIVRILNVPTVLLAQDHCFIDREWKFGVILANLDDSMHLRSPFSLNAHSFSIVDCTFGKMELSFSLDAIVFELANEDLAIGQYNSSISM